MRTLLPLVALAFVAGCGGSVADPIDSGASDGGADAPRVDTGLEIDAGRPCPSTELGKSIYGGCFDAITVNDIQGGFGPPPPPGSDCNVIGDVHDLDLKTGTLVRVSCAATGPQSAYKKSTTTRTLAPGALAGVVTALQAVTVVSANACVSDGPTLTLVVKAKGQSTTYGDEKWSACAGTPVTGLQGVITALLSK